MKTYRVKFLPDEKNVLIEKDGSILEAAIAAGIEINSICSGNGQCGRCKVRIISEDRVGASSGNLPQEEIDRGYSLACRTFLNGDAVVEILPDSFINGTKQSSIDKTTRFGTTSQATVSNIETKYALSPLSRKEYLELPLPTLDDSISDQERIWRELQTNFSIPNLQAGLTVIREFPKLLRKNAWKVTATLGLRGNTVELIQLEPQNTTAVNFGVAVDVGTTTVVAKLVDLNSGKTVGVDAKYNSQISYGEDVISRIIYASTPERSAELREKVVGDINELIGNLTKQAKIKLCEITYVLCAGNTTMTHLLYGIDSSNIRREPYVPAVSSMPVIRAKEIGVNINPRGLLGSLPSVASYIGGDVVADALICGIIDSEELALLIDMGTNGELVVGNSEWLVCCSASAGPCFEGVGISSGMRATTGAIERIELSDDGKISSYSVVGGGKPKGLCGSGIIDAIAEFLRIGCIDRTGRFIEGACENYLRINESGEKEFLIFSAQELEAERDIVISEADIFNLIRAKGAIYMAAEALLKHMSLEFNDIQKIYVAGGFGSYLKIPQAIRIGLLPDLPLERFKVIGNGSIEGAKNVLLSKDALNAATEKVASKMTYFELSTDPLFMNEYNACLFLPHTDIEKFPSVVLPKKARS